MHAVPLASAELCASESLAQRTACSASTSVAIPSSAAQSVCWRALLLIRRPGMQEERNAALRVELLRGV